MRISRKASVESLRLGKLITAQTLLNKIQMTIAEP
jgi:hypothetical protein